MPVDVMYDALIERDAAYRPAGIHLELLALIIHGDSRLQRFVSRVLVGLLAALVYRAMQKTKLPLYVRGAVTGFSAALFNTLFFMSLLVLLFGNTPELHDKIAAKGVIMYIVTSVGINAVVEMAVAAVVTGAVGAALRKARLIG